MIRAMVTLPLSSQAPATLYSASSDKAPATDGLLTS